MLGCLFLRFVGFRVRWSRYRPFSDGCGGATALPLFLRLCERERAWKRGAGSAEAGGGLGPGAGCRGLQGTRPRSTLGAKRGSQNPAGELRSQL